MKWPYVKIEDIKSNQAYSLVGGPFGSNLVTKDYMDDGIPVIRGINLPDDKYFSEDDLVFVSEEKANSLFSNNAHRGDLIFTQRGTLGQVGLIPLHSTFDRYLISQSQMKLSVNPEKASPEYVYYFFRHPNTIQSIKNHAITSGVPHINLGILKNFELPLPPLTIQENISKVLSAYDKFIENNRRRIELLEQAAMELYKEWFVYLRFPGHKHTRIKNGLPEGWEKKKLIDVSNITMGQSPKSVYYNTDGEGWPFHQGVSDFGVRFITHSTYCTVKNRIGEAGDILFSVRAPVGRLNITLDKIVIGRGLSAIRSKINHQSFLYYQLRTHFFKEDMIGTGAIFAAITKNDLHSLELPLPDYRLIAEFQEHSLSIDGQIKNLFLQNQKLRQGRDLLLPKLMNGSIEV